MTDLRNTLTEQEQKEFIESLEIEDVKETKNISKEQLEEKSQHFEEFLENLK